MNAIIKVTSISILEILFSIGINYFYFFKIFLGTKLRFTRYDFLVVGAWSLLYWYCLFYLIYCIKQYVCPNEFYDLPIQIIVFGGTGISMIITWVIGVSAMKSR
jgi:hypothetical protein